MRNFALVTLCAAVSLLNPSCSAVAKDAAMAAPAPAKQAVSVQQDRRATPKLVIAISVDQFSADLYAQYRPYFTGGLKRLSGGAVFPSAYQSHAATETCPGHSTILTGVHPARTGIIANRWFSLDATREDKRIYCAEDENIAGSSSREYTASASHLLVPTLGERLKAKYGGSRNIAVAGKDRSALMMGGNNIDEVYWWGGKDFATLNGRTLSAQAIRANADIAAQLSQPWGGYSVPGYCAARDKAIRVSDELSVGTYKFARPAGEPNLYRTSPALDKATLDLAEALVISQNLGKNDAPDVLSIGLAATDYVGHAFGTEGVEMCIQIAELDKALGQFFDNMDKTGIDYAVMLTSDHGGHDLPERLRMQAVPDADRATLALETEALDAAVRPLLTFDWQSPVFFSEGPFGDFYITRDMDAGQREEALVAVSRLLRENNQVAAVFSRQDLDSAPMPKGPVRAWSLLERARASYHPDRSGDFVVLLKRGITPIPRPGIGYVATHGSPWDYDRRVPLLFWRSDMTGFEQPVAVQTVDIAPTLASLLNLESEAGAFDGRCLDLDPGPESTCN